MLDYTGIFPSMTLLQDLLLESAGAFPDRTALIDVDASWSYQRLLARSHQYAQAFQEAGLLPGDRIGLLMENGPEYVSAYFGVFLAGCVAVPLDFKSQAVVLAGILQDCKVECLTVTSAQVSRLKSILEFAQPLRWLICSSQLPLGSYHLNCISANTQEAVTRDVRNGPSSPAVINYTAGSSSRPKGVVMSHRAILANTRSIIAYLELTHQDRIMQVLPFFYCYGASLLHTHLMVGGSVVIDNRFLYPSAVLSNMAQARCTGFAGVPSTFHTLVTKCNLRDSFSPALRYVTQAGGRMHPQLVDAIRAAIAPARLFIMYGQTEASARLTYLEPERWTDKRGSVGQPIPGVSLKVATETGVEAPPGTVAEIWVRGENLMSGYWGEPGETSRVLVDGWLRTGDLGYLDEDGFLFIKGRVTEIIKSGGFRISPGEVEDVLIRHPAVSEVAVLGFADSQSGEMVSAVLALKEGQAVSEVELIRHCKSILPAYKIPQRIVLLPELPKSASGKLQKELLAKLFAPSTERIINNPEIR
jgi:acyl-CoA synthetase (AMP-forming)/AMP-acid ligase II